jgi:hypothetical protein
VIRAKIPVVAGTSIVSTSIPLPSAYVQGSYLSKTHPTVTKDSNTLHSTTKVLPTQQKRDGSVVRMSNADRLRPGLGLPMSDRLMVTGPVERRAPTTSPHPSLAHPCQWIRRHTRRYTEQGAAFNNLNSLHMKASAPPTSQSHRVLHPILRYPSESDRFQNYTPTATAHRRASLRASERSHPPPAGNKPMPHRTWSCAANTRRPLQPYTLLTHTTFSNQTLSITRRPPCLYLPAFRNPTSRSSSEIDQRPNLPMTTSAPEPRGGSSAPPLPHGSATPHRRPRPGLAAGTRPGRQSLSAHGPYCSTTFT